MNDPRHQKLVDICYSLVLTATDPEFKNFFGKASIEQKADWVTGQLKDLGFPTWPCGSKWGILVEKE